jgi:hypothetical protein
MPDAHKLEQTWNYSQQPRRLAILMPAQFLEFDFDQIGGLRPMTHGRR